MKAFLVLSSVILAVIAAPPSGGEKTKRHLLDSYVYDTLPQTYYNAPTYYSTLPIQSKMVLPEQVILNAPEHVVVKAPEPVVLRTAQPVVVKAPEPVVFRTAQPVVVRAPEQVVLRTPQPVVLRAHQAEQVLVKPTEQIVLRSPEVINVQHAAQSFYPQLVNPIYPSEMYSSRVIVN